jgi:hypothetical protein
MPWQSAHHDQTLQDAGVPDSDFRIKSTSSPRIPLPIKELPVPTKNDAATSAKWRDAPQGHDYPAAASYLSLLWPPDQADPVVMRLRAAPAMSFADIACRIV